MRSTLVVVMLGSLWLGSPARADVVVRYVAPHPLPPEVGKGMCHIEGPHVHVYRPHKPKLYVKVDGHFSFVGDHSEFDRKAPRHAYYGHHPVFWVDPDGFEEVEHYCYITGPHYHYYAPPPSLRFKMKGGFYWYVNAHPRWYKKRRRRYRYIDRYYATVHVPRPVVTVEPPVGFVGVLVGGPHLRHGRARVRGGVYVRGGVHVAPPPGVRVDVRVPSVGVVFGGRGGPPPRHYRVRHRRRRVHHAPAWGHRKHKKRKKRKRGRW